MSGERKQKDELKETIKKPSFQLTGSHRSFISAE